jgi:hypothetical protein
VHTARQEELFGAHPQLFMAADPQCPLCHPNRLADLGDVQRLVGAFLYCPVKPLHNECVAALRCAILNSGTLDKAANHGLDQCLLQSTRGLRDEQ